MTYFSAVARFCIVLLGLFSLPTSLLSGVFTVTNSESSGPGSLAQAVDDANATPGPHQIVFAIPGPGVQKIDLSAGGLVLRSSITIDGYTQPGASVNTLPVGDNAVILIQLDGGGFYFSQSPGLTINGDNCVIRGLCFTGFTNISPDQFTGAIVIGDPYKGGGNNNRIEGNFIGLSPDGVTLDGNSWGVFFWNSNEGNIIGGSVPEARNIISGNSAGVSGCKYSTIAGNYFGTDASGSGQGYGNDYGIVAFDHNVIGTGASSGGNVITGSYYGIEVFGQNTVLGNLIGPYADGSASFGNTYGILVQYTDINGADIGGMGAGAGNVIAFNTYGASVGTFGGPTGGTSILSNLFYANSFTDLTLGYGGSVNDFLDLDIGPNLLQNFPIIMSVERDADHTVVAGGLNSRPSTTFTLQFYAQKSGSTPSERLLGTKEVTTNDKGDAPFQFALPIATSLDEFVTATATDPFKNTSQFFPRDGLADLSNISTRGNINAGDNILIGGFILFQGNARQFLIRALGPSLNVPGALADPRIEVRGSSGEFLGSNDNWADSQYEEIVATGLAPNNPQEAALIVPLQPFYGPNYTVLVQGAEGDYGTATFEVYALGVPSEYEQKFLNISTRGYVGTGDDALIGGTILQGSKGQELIVRAIGPDLTAAGVSNALQDPTLELRDAAGNLLASNDDWRSNQEQEIIATGLAPNDDRDAAILISVYPTSYTAIVRGKNGETGLALVEIYKLGDDEP